MAVIIKKLEAANLDQVSRFRMGDEEDKGLQIFIRRDARKSAQANLTQTYVAKRDGEKKVIGYSVLFGLALHQRPLPSRGGQTVRSHVMLTAS